MIVLHDPKQTDVLWPSIWKHLRKAVEQDFFENEESIKEKIGNGSNAVLIAFCGNIKGVAVLEPCDAKERICILQFVAGEGISEWGVDMDNAVTEYAKAMDCTKVIANGRKAWSRIWPSYKSAEKILFYKEVV